MRLITEKKGEERLLLFTLCLGVEGLLLEPWVMLGENPAQLCLQSLGLPVSGPGCCVFALILTGKGWRKGPHSGPWDRHVGEGRGCLLRWGGMLLQFGARF